MAPDWTSQRLPTPSGGNRRSWQRIGSVCAAHSITVSGRRYIGKPKRRPGTYYPGSDLLTNLQAPNAHPYHNRLVKDAQSRDSGARFPGSNVLCFTTSTSN